MKNISKNMSLLICLIGILTMSYGQNPSRDLQDLVGEKGNYAEMDLEKRGYVHIKTDKSGYDVYSSWWNSSKNKCVTYHLSDGKVKSVVDVPPADCNKSSSHGHSRTDDLVGLSVEVAAERMSSRGFVQVDKFKKDGKTHRIYFNRDTRQCVDLRSMHEKVGHVENSTRCN